MARSTTENSSRILGSPKGRRPIPTPARSAATSRPKISQMQISADRSGSSSYPIIHSATMQRGSSIALARSSNRPYWGV